MVQHLSNAVIDLQFIVDEEKLSFLNVVLSGASVTDNFVSDNTA